LTDVLASILIVLPVEGFLPSLAGLWTVEKVPKPTNAALSPLLRLVSIEPKTASTALPACAFEIPAASATALIKSQNLVTPVILVYFILSLVSK